MMREREKVEDGVTDKLVNIHVDKLLFSFSLHINWHIIISDILRFTYVKSAVSFFLSFNIHEKFFVLC